MPPECALRKRVPDSLRWAGRDIDLSWMQRWHLPSLPVYLELREGPVPDWRPSPIPLPPDLALRDPTQAHPECTRSPNAPAPPGLFFRRLPRACSQAGCGFFTNEMLQDEAHYVLEEQTVCTVGVHLTSSMEVANP